VPQSGRDVLSSRSGTIFGWPPTPTRLAKEQEVDLFE